MLSHSVDSTIYIYLDEGGNFDFSPDGSTFLTFTAVATVRPLRSLALLQEVRCDFLEAGINLERFHASEDQQRTRNAVFDMNTSHLRDFAAASVIVEKAKANPKLRSVEKIYPLMVDRLLASICRQLGLDQCEQIIIVTDTIPERKKRGPVASALALKIEHSIPTVRYRLYHHDSRSSTGLQIADYLNWAIYRKWNAGDTRSYDRIRECVIDEVDVFRDGTTRYY